MSVFTYIALGLSALAVAGLGVVSEIIGNTSLWVVGSNIRPGHEFVVPDANTTLYPSLYVNTGAVATHVEPVKITGSGSDNDYLTAHVQVPTQYYSGALLEMASIECGNVGTPSTGSLVINLETDNKSISDGTSVRDHIYISTGSTVTINTGSMLNTKITADWYVSFISSVSGSTVHPATHDCYLKTRFREKYGR